MELDAIDLKILRELQADARLTNVELASRVNLSPSPCLARVKALEAAGYIRQRVTLLGFLDGYDKGAAPTLTILAPSGSDNEAAAAAAARDFARVATRNGVHSSRIAMASYQADPTEVSAPIRVSYAKLRAHTDKCGRWPEDIADTTENKHYANFGCAYQNNLAAQMANPADLLGPRKQSSIDAANRSRVIGVYRSSGNGVTAGEVNY